MAVVNHTFRWLYFMEPHTASRAVRRMLMGQCGGSEIGNHHISSEELLYWRRQHIRKVDFQRLTKICTVRNPLDVLVTKWKQHPKSDTPLEQWFEEHKHNLKINFGLYKEADIFCWYEDLQDDLRWVFRNQNLTLEYNQDHKTKTKAEWQTYYTEEFMHKVIAQCEPYIKKFGYSYEYDFNGEINVTIDKDVRRRLCVPLCEFKLPR